MNDKSAETNEQLGDENDKSPSVSAEREEDHSVSTVVDSYIKKVREIEKTADIVLPHVRQWIDAERQRALANLEKRIPGFPDNVKEESNKAFQKSGRIFAEFISAVLRFSEVVSNNDGPNILSRALFMQMFSEFDAFTGNLLKAIYIKNDGLLKSISREISFSDLLDHGTLDSVKRYMLEKEIETFRRDSYVEQFSSLENKFKINLRKFKEWAEFVELGQRRNLFAHNGGVVSDQYLLVCEREGYRFESRPAMGDCLSISAEYFTRGAAVLSKVAFMLGYTLWAKVFPKEVGKIHEALNDTLYRCLERKEWDFVSEMNEFCLSEPMRKGASEIQIRIRLVNIAIGLKFSGRDQEAMALLESMDWSASYRDFKLAMSVLRDDFTEAIDIMRQIGKSGELVRQSAYHSWPLFEKFREHAVFHSLYEEIYGESFLEQQVRSSTSSVAERPTNNASSEIFVSVMAGKEGPQKDGGCSAESAPS